MTTAAPRIEYEEREFRGRLYRVSPETAPRFDTELPMLQAIAGVKRGETFIDVGAGVGEFAIRAAAMGVHVIAFEPHLPQRRELVRNVQLNELLLVANGLHHGEVFVDGIAIWDGTPYPEDLRKEMFGRRYPTNELEFATIDVFNLAEVDWIKVDVGSRPLEVLLGARETLAKKRPNVVVDLTEAYARPVRNFLFGLGYELRFESKPSGALAWCTATHPGRGER